jgi:hypothetical protein
MGTSITGEAVKVYGRNETAGFVCSLDKFDLSASSGEQDSGGETANSSTDDNGRRDVFGFF